MYKLIDKLLIINAVLLVIALVLCSEASADVLACNDNSQTRGVLKDVGDTGDSAVIKAFDYVDEDGLKMTAYFTFHNCQVLVERK